MNPMLLMLLFMKLVASFPPVTSFQANKDVYVSTEEGNWVEARSLCKETNGTNDFLSGCQPWNCNPYSLNTTIKAMGIDTTYWLRGYVLRSRIMEYNGCYQISDYYGTTQQVFNLTFGDNPIIQCSMICNDTQNGDVILFSNTTCYCVNKSFYNDWKKRTTFKEISSDRCNFKCPGDEYNRCGSDIDVTVLSGYTFKPLNPDPIFNTVGQFCFYVNGRQQINYTECSRQLKFKCQKIEISSGKKEWDSDCNHLVVNWYDARKTCKQNRFLQIYPDNECKDNNFKQGEETWHNRFLTAKIIWNKDDPPEDSCLALLVTKNGEYKLVSRGCNQNHTTLCRKGESSTASKSSTVSTLYTESNLEKSDKNKEITQNNEGPLIGGAVGGLLAIVFLGVVIVFIKRKHRGTQHKRAANLSVYYSTVADNDNAILVPNPPQTAPEYIYVGESDINRPTNDNNEDTYNILHEDEQRRQDNTSGPIYDHSGVKDGDYDLTNASNGRLADTVHNVYDDSRTLENLYDETTQGKRTDNIMPSIYDHA